MKTCRSCNTKKSLTEFHKRKNSSDGYQHYCKPCMVSRVTEFRARKTVGIPMPPIGIKKICKGCGHEKDVSEFDRTPRGFIRSKCIECWRNKNSYNNTLKAG